MASVERLPRETSIDLVRGADVLLMLFVNEMAGVRGTPAFLLHKPHDVDGMTITDVVFPAFLFITGLAIPFALGGRLRRGDTGGGWRHILTRTIALLVMGVLMVNAERPGTGGVISPDLWSVLMSVGVVLVWLAPSRDGPARGQPWLRIAGAVVLVALLFLYRSRDATGFIQIRPQWWGILGLIGWSYLVAASAYVLARDRPAVLLGVVALLYCVYLADEAGRAGWLAALAPYFRVGRTMASHSAVAVSGTLLGVMLLRHRQAGEAPRTVVSPALGYAAGLAGAGLLLHALHGLHPAFWVNKVLATPPWCLLSSAITAVCWLGIFALTDLKGWRRWPKAVSIAGENALLCYLMAPFLLSLFALSAPLFAGNNFYEKLGESTVIGFIRSTVFAWVVVRLCGLLRDAGVRMQL
jgi:heparan-alpha-glucosaminide N-acetyltransferase